MSRLLGELEVRAVFVLQLPDDLRKEFVEIAATKSPSAAFDLASRLAAINGVDSLAAAKAARWLAVIRRDYGQAEFDRITVHAQGVSLWRKIHPMGKKGEGWNY